jgi:hypothetical protein
MQRLFLFEAVETIVQKKSGQLIEREITEKIENLNSGLLLLADILKTTFPHCYRFGIIGFIESTLRQHGLNKLFPRKIMSSPSLFNHFHCRSPELLFALRCFIDLGDIPHSQLKSARDVAEKIIMVCDKTTTEFERAAEMKALLQEFAHSSHTTTIKAGI